MNDYAKENYQTPFAGDLEYWRGHITWHIAQRYISHFHGAMADFGCGHGVKTYLLAELPGVDRVIGIDLYLKGIEKLPANEKVWFVRADLRDLVLLPLWINAGICFHILEHIYSEDLNTVLREMQWTLKPGGKLLVIVPNGEAYYNDTHVNLFDVQKLWQVLEAVNFKVLECYLGEEENLIALVEAWC